MHEEKSVPSDDGHPSTLHLWWARTTASNACRAVLFASLVDDPFKPVRIEFPTEEDQLRERKRLFDLIEELVKWENINNERYRETSTGRNSQVYRWESTAQF